MWIYSFIIIKSISKKIRPINQLPKAFWQLAFLKKIAFWLAMPQISAVTPNLRLRDGCRSSFGAKTRVSNGIN